MLKDETHKAIDKFAKRIVKNSKQRLARKNSDTRNLEGSIGYDLKVHKQSFSLSFHMLDYGAFVDEGVQGKKSSSKAPHSPFKFKTKMPPIQGLKKWATKRGINPYAVQRSIFNTGLKATEFFSKPFEHAFKQLPDIIVDAYGLQIDEFLEQTLNN